MPYTGQRRSRVVRFHGDEEGISGLDLVRVCRDRDRHGEVDQPGDDDPVALEKGRTVAACNEDDLCASTYQMRPNDGPQRPGS